MKYKKNTNLSTIFIYIRYYMYLYKTPVLSFLNIAFPLFCLLILVLPEFLNLCFIILQRFEVILENVLPTPLYNEANDYSLHMEVSGGGGERGSGEGGSGEGSSGNRAIASQPSFGNTELISQPSPSKLKQLSFMPTLPKIIENPNPSLILDFGNRTFRNIFEEKANYILAKLELEKFPREVWFEPNLEKEATFDEKDILRAWAAKTIYKRASLYSLGKKLINHEEDPLSHSLGIYLEVGTKKYYEFQDDLLFSFNTDSTYELAMKYLKTERIINTIVKDCFKKN